MNRLRPALLLPRSPLVYVVLQVRTAAVISLEKFVPEIQESLRHSGFPKFTKSKVHEIKVIPDSAPTSNSFDRFEFQSRNSRIGIVLTANAIALHTSEYKTFDHFLDLLKTAYENINPILNIEFAERVGLRYVDLIRLSRNETLAEYIRPGILGPDENAFGMSHTYSRFETVGTTAEGILAFRHWQMSDGTFLPPDLQPSTLNHSIELDPNERISLLDFDHFAERQIDFDFDTLRDISWRLHKNLDSGFRGVVTETALNRWGASES